MLKRIKIDGFKSIQRLNLALNPINILIGANGVGRSNFISFFRLVNNMYEQRLQQYSLKSGVDNLLYYGRKNTSSIKGYLDFEDSVYSFTLEPTEKDTLFLSLESHVNTVSTPRNLTVTKENHNESVIKDSDKEKDKVLQTNLQSYKIYHFHDTSVSSPMRSRVNINDNRVLREDGSNLPAYLYFLQEKYPKTFKRIEQTIQSISPFFERFNLTPFALDENAIFLEWIDKEHPDMYFNATHLSDGSLRFIALCTLLLQPNLPSLLIIDEPELGLHPAAIDKISGLIRSVSKKGCQVIISTQSETMLNNFEPDDIITVDREDNQSVFHRLEKSKLNSWLDDYSIGELWNKSVIKGQPL